MDSGRNQNAAQLSKGSKHSDAYGDTTDSKKRRDGSRDARSQAPADHQQRAEQELDWFKFETRIRTVIKDLMEPAHLRSQEIEKEYKKMRDLVTRLSKKLDAAEHQIEKIERKSSSQDELFQKVGVLDQNVKIHETRTSSELNNMNSNLELLKENMRRDTADVEENGKQIRKLHESINQLYEQILDAKKDLAAQVQKEARELQTKLLETKQYFEDQKDHVTQFDSTVQHLQRENLKRKAEIDGQFSQLSNQLDKYQLEIQRAERSYDGALDQFKVVFNQNLDLEAKVMTCTKKAAQSATEWKQITKRFERYVSIMAPMQSFTQTQRVLDHCLRHQELNKFAELAKDTIWPELQGNYAKYDKSGGQSGLLLDLDRPFDPPAPPELQEEPDFVTKDQAEEMIFKAVQAAGSRVSRAAAHRPVLTSQRGPEVFSQRHGMSQQSKTTDQMNSANSRAHEASQRSEEKAGSGPRQAETKTPTPALQPSSPARKAPSPGRVASPHSPSEKMQVTIQNEGGQAASEMSNYRSQREAKAETGRPEDSYAGKDEVGAKHVQREMPRAPRSQQMEKRIRGEKPAKPGSDTEKQSQGQARRDAFAQDSAPGEEPYVDKSVKKEQSEDLSKQGGDHKDAASKKESSKQGSEAPGTPKPGEEQEIGAKSPHEAEENIANEAKDTNPKSEQVQKEKSQASVSGAAPAQANEADPASRSQPSSASRTKEAKAPTPVPRSGTTSKHNEDQSSRKESKAKPNAKKIRQKDEGRVSSKQEEARTQQNPLPESKKREQEPSPHGTTPQPKKEEQSSLAPLAQLDESRICEIFVELRAKYREEDRQQMKQMVEQAVRQSGKNAKVNDGEKSRAYGDLLDRIEDVNYKIEDVYDQIDHIRGMNSAEDRAQSKRAPSGRGGAPSLTTSTDKALATDAMIRQKFAEQDANLEKQMDQMRRLEGLLKKRAQRESDFTSERTKTQSVFNQFKFEIDNIYNKLAVVLQAICVLNEMHKLQSAITHQEEEDKRSVALYGLQATTGQQSATQATGKNPGSSQAKRTGTSASPPARAGAGAGASAGPQPSSYASALGSAASAKQQTVFTINKLCASCSGQNQHVIKLFKLACIHYQSSRVSYQGHELERDMVADLQSHLCGQVQMLMHQDGDYGLGKIMNDKQLEIAQLVETAVLMQATKARSLLTSEDNKITSQPAKFYGEAGVAHETWYKGGAGQDGKPLPAKHEKTFANQQSSAESTLVAGLAATADPHQARNARAPTDNLQVQLPQTTTASQMDELVKTAGASQGTGPDDSHRTRTPSPEPLNDQPFKMVHDIYSNKQAASLAQGHHSMKVARHLQQGTILTKAASALKYAPHFEEYEKDNRNRGAAFPPGALDSESVHNQSNHSTIYAPNNLLSSSRKHHGHAKAIEALKRSTGSRLPQLRHSSVEWQASPAAEPDIDVMIKVRNNAHEPISIAGANLAGGGPEESQLRSIYNTDQVNFGYPLRALESQARSTGKLNSQATFMVKRTSNQNAKQKQPMLFEQQHNRSKMTASAEQIREQPSVAGQATASLKSNPYNLHRHDQKKLTEFKSAALMRPVTQQYTVGDLATTEPHGGKQSQMVLGAKHGAAGLGSRILSLDANAGGTNARLPAAKQIGLQVDGEAATIGQQITLGAPNGGSILIKNKLHEKRIPYQSGKRPGGLRQ